MPKSNDVTWKEFVAHPIATIGAVVSIVGGGLAGVIEPLLGTVWSQAGAFFAVASVGRGTLADQFAWLPKGALTAAAVGAGLVFVANRGWKIVQGYRKETQE
ncbi:hypothetical protein [Natronomonas marina]|uniref:hypothetical protein n=1 Tax=Natronomonas marina TaxID=2961939 RepID=UPI0020CA01CD|nr:hypothetical protein [Natronomonas marina]